MISLVCGPFRSHLSLHVEQLWAFGPGRTPTVAHLVPLLAVVLLLHQQLLPQLAARLALFSQLVVKKSVFGLKPLELLLTSLQFGVAAVFELSREELDLFDFVVDLMILRLDR